MMLRWEDVYPDKPDENGKTPFSFAARWGDKEVVKLLLGRENFNSDKKDNCG